MARKRFRWTRELYYTARHLARLLSRLQDLPACPALLERYWELWSNHPQRSDPLAVPFMQRDSVRNHIDGIPF